MRADNMSDQYWDDVATDHDSVRRTAALVRGKVEVAQFWPFLSGAADQGQFEDRLQIVSAKIETLVDPSVLEAVVSSLRDDYSLVSEASIKTAVSDTCTKCNSQIHRDDHDTWVDNSGGDVCGAEGDNDPHTPSYDEKNSKHSRKAARNYTWTHTLKNDDHDPDGGSLNEGVSMKAGDKVRVIDAKPFNDDNGDDWITVHHERTNEEALTSPNNVEAIPGVQAPGFHTKRSYIDPSDAERYSHYPTPDAQQFGVGRVEEGGTEGFAPDPHPELETGSKAKMEENIKPGVWAPVPGTAMPERPMPQGVARGYQPVASIDDPKERENHYLRGYSDAVSSNGDQRNYQPKRGEAGVHYQQGWTDGHEELDARRNRTASFDKQGFLVEAIADSDWSTDVSPAARAHVTITHPEKNLDGTAVNGGKYHANCSTCGWSQSHPSYDLIHPLATDHQTQHQMEQHDDQYGQGDFEHTFPHLFSKKQAGYYNDEGQSPYAVGYEHGSSGDFNPNIKDPEYHRGWKQGHEDEAPVRHPSKVHSIDPVWASKVAFDKHGYVDATPGVTQKGNPYYFNSDGHGIASDPADGFPVNPSADVEPSTNRVDDFYGAVPPAESKGSAQGLIDGEGYSRQASASPNFSVGAARSDFRWPMPSSAEPTDEERAAEDAESDHSMGVHLNSQDHIRHSRWADESNDYKGAYNDAWTHHNELWKRNGSKKEARASKDIHDEADVMGRLVYPYDDGDADHYTDGYIDAHIHHGRGESLDTHKNFKAGLPEAYNTGYHHGWESASSDARYEGRKPVHASTNGRIVDNCPGCGKPRRHHDTPGGRLELHHLHNDSARCNSKTSKVKTASPYSPHFHCNSASGEPCPNGVHQNPSPESVEAVRLDPKYRNYLLATNRAEFDWAKHASAKQFFDPTDASIHVVAENVVNPAPTPTANPNDDPDQATDTGGTPQADADDLSSVGSFHQAEYISRPDAFNPTGYGADEYAARTRDSFNSTKPMQGVDDRNINTPVLGAEPIKTLDTDHNTRLDQSAKQGDED